MDWSTKFISFGKTLIFVDNKHQFNICIWIFILVYIKGFNPTIIDKYTRQGELAEFWI